MSLGRGVSASSLAGSNTVGDGAEVAVGRGSGLEGWGPRTESIGTQPTPAIRTRTAIAIRVRDRRSLGRGMRLTLSLRVAPAIRFASGRSLTQHLDRA